MSYKVVPITLKIAEETRETLTSPQYESMPAFVSVANGYGPCRSCLNTFDEGNEERIYFTYNAFEGLSNLPQPGPIYIHKDNCVSFAGDSFPEGLRGLPILFEGFGEESKLLRRENVDEKKLESQIAEIFVSPDVKFINIRNAEAGCFIARIDRT